MKGYKIDTHIHTSETSNCGKVKASKILRFYKDENYSGLVITDHYARGFFETQGKKTWNEKIDNFLKGYFSAKKEGERIGINIFLGMEISFESEPNDYLIYGIDEHFLYNNKELYKLNISEFRDIIKNKNILIYQAHPFRSICFPTNPKFLDGVEVYNGNYRHNSNNRLAMEFAQKNNLNRLSGSDFHQKDDLGRGGILLPDNPKKLSTFVKMIKNNSQIELIES
ncbi:MAG: PHP domain-containing protein [Clostridiales bacterium]